MPIRIRIASATAILMVISLAILGTGVYLTMSRNLQGDLEQRLQNVYRAYLSDADAVVAQEGTIRLINPDPLSTTGVLVQVTGEDWEADATSPNLQPQTISVPTDIRQSNQGLKSRFYTTTIGDRQLRVLSGPLGVTNGEVRYVQIAELTNPIDSTLQELRRNLIIGSIMATIVLTLGAWLIADASLRPLSSMSGTARRIGRTSDLSQRIDPPETRDEVEYLAETFNDMLARLEETFNAQRRFVADASHELRTPLTALRANADIMLRQIESGLGERSDLLEGLEDVRDEVDRMTRLVQNLLTLARADVGWRPEMETVELANVVRDAARVASPLSQGHLLRLDVPDDDDADDARVYGNEDQIRQLILILLDNAFTYTPSGTEVRLSLRTEDSEAVIRVSDDGPGIPPQHLQNVFERFYRADASRARSSGGSGLGLAIARWIVTIHNGSIEAASDESDGTVFTIRLPMVEDEAPRPTGLLRRSRAESALAGS